MFRTNGLWWQLFGKDAHITLRLAVLGVFAVVTTTGVVAMAVVVAVLVVVVCVVLVTMIAVLCCML